MMTLITQTGYHYPDGYDGTVCRIDATNGNILAQTFTWRPCSGGLSLADTDNDGVFELYQGDRGIYYGDGNYGAGERSWWAENLTIRWNRLDASNQQPSTRTRRRKRRRDIRRNHRNVQRNEYSKLNKRPMDKPLNQHRPRTRPKRSHVRTLRHNRLRHRRRRAPRTINQRRRPRRQQRNRHLRPSYRPAKSTTTP